MPDPECRIPNNKVHAQFQAFNTSVNITLYCNNTIGNAALQSCKAACVRYENLFSRTIESSDIYKLNSAEGKWVEVDKETFEILKASISYCRESMGVFDITIGSASRLWDFKNGKLASLLELKRACKHVGYNSLFLSSTSGAYLARLEDPYAAIDLGGIAKGYIADRLIEMLMHHEVDGCVVDLGGNIAVAGEKPSGQPWKIALRAPRAPKGLEVPTSVSTMPMIEIKRGSVVTSGLYERAFVSNGKLYHHILNPENGMPINSEFAAVSLVCMTSIDAEGFSTSLLALGPEKAKSLMKRHPEILKAYFIRWDGTIEQPDIKH